MPPSTTRVCPVMYADSGDKRNRTTPATSFRFTEALQGNAAEHLGADLFGQVLGHVGA